MKITVPLFSRGRPAGLLSVLTALNAMATGKNEICYPLIVDDDDALTLAHVGSWFDDDMLPDGASDCIGKRDRTLNARMNEVAAEYPADAYYFAPDDGFPLCQHWDNVFAAAHAQGLPAWCWIEHNDPQNTTFICLSEKWRAALGRCFPEYFPYWFADTWIAEVHLLCFAKPMPVVNQLGMGGKRGKTQGMRDLAFWFRFFAHTRSERIAEAQTLARAYGFTVNVEKERGHFLKALEEFDAGQQLRCAKYEERFATGEPPTEVYIAAKEQAEAMMERRIVVLN